MDLMDNQYPLSDLTHRIIGCAMEVHRTLGNGFQETIYQRALAIELAAAGLEFTREFDMEIHYKGHVLGTRRVDFLVQGIVSIELKALTHLEDVHLAQALNYLEAYNLEVGLLINFGAKSLEFRRLMRTKTQPLAESTNAPSRTHPNHT